MVAAWHERGNITDDITVEKCYGTIVQYTH